jgi:hypothetical protein
LNTIAELNDPFEYLFSLGPIIHINIKDMENDKKLIYQEIINFKEKEKNFDEGKINELNDYKNKLDKNFEEFNNKYKTFSDVYNEHENSLKNLKLKSFSLINENIKMWSIYTNKHKGYCVGFLFGNPKIQELFFNINYVRERESFKSIFTKPGELLQNFHSKSKEWEFEKEVRFFAGKYDERYFHLEENCIQSIYLGAKIEPKNKDLILDYTADLNIPIYQMHLNEHEFKLDCKLIK